MLGEKIAFANISDKDGNKNTRLDSNDWLKTERFSAVIACGGNPYKFIKRKLNGQNIHLVKVVHPSIRNYIYHRVGWNKYWSYHGACLDRIQNEECYSFVKKIVDGVNEKLSR